MVKEEVKVILTTPYKEMDTFITLDSIKHLIIQPILSYRNNNSLWRQNDSPNPTHNHNNNSNKTTTSGVSVTVRSGSQYRHF